MTADRTFILTVPLMLWLTLSKRKATSVNYTVRFSSPAFLPVSVYSGDSSDPGAVKHLKYGHFNALLSWPQLESETNLASRLMASVAPVLIVLTFRNRFKFRPRVTHSNHAVRDQLIHEMRDIIVFVIRLLIQMSAAGWHLKVVAINFIDGFDSSID